MPSKPIKEKLISSKDLTQMKDSLAEEGMLDVLSFSLVLRGLQQFPLNRTRGRYFLLSANHLT